MRPAARRWALIIAVGVLGVVLVGGRWAAFETAERAWAASLPGGAAYLAERDLARLVAGLLLLAAIVWGTANLLFVYRSIGSMQVSRRLGDLEIVEAVPQPVLLAGTVAGGVVFGLLLAWGKGDWWMSAALAWRGVHVGLADPLLHRDVGYYLAELPWSARLRGFVFVALVSATGLVALLYAAIGSLRFRRWLPWASAHARAHLGLLLTLLAGTLMWDALLDPAETVAGLHGPLAPLALAARMRAAPFVAAVGGLAVGASAVWALRERPRLLLGAWGALVVTVLLGFDAIPSSLAGGAGRAESPSADTAQARVERRWEGLAFGVAAAPEGVPPALATPGAAVAAFPLWNPGRVLAAARHRDLVGARAQPVAAALSAHAGGAGRAGWVIALGPEFDERPRGEALDWSTIHRGPWAHTGRPLGALEDDTTLVFERLPVRDSATWFGPAFSEFAVVAPDTWPALARSGIALANGWQRTALAWVLQSPALARPETDGLVLLWRRDVPARLERLAPFAGFDPATPVLSDGALWWLSYGYLEASGFPVVAPLEWDGRPVRYLRAALVGAVNAATGATRLYLAPEADPLARAWAALLGSLIQPFDSLPAALRSELPFPSRTFRAAAVLAGRRRADTTVWVPRSREPFELVAPAGGESGAGGAGVGSRVWMGQGFEAGSTFAALVAATMAPEGPRLVVWRPTPLVRLPPGLVGSPSTTAPGVARQWLVGAQLFSEQALFTEPARGGPPVGIDSVFLSWGQARGQGGSAAAALRNLVAAERGGAGAADTTLAARWQQARRLTARADAALAAGDLETFGRLYAELKELLGLARRRVAPPPGRR